MKRRIAFALAAIMATSMLCACGGNTTAENLSQTSGTESGTSAVTSENSTSSADTESSAPEATTSATTAETTTATTAPAEPEIPVELPVLNVEPALIMNGSMAFKADGKNYVYNITENEMYETEYDVDDITVLKGCIAVIGYVESNKFDNPDVSVINLKTGELYTNVKPFYNSNWYNNDYLTVGKIEKNFTNNVISIGLLDNNGEWVLPLSTDYTICATEYVNNMTYVYQNNNVIGFQNYLYDIAKDNIIALENPDGSMGVLDITDESIILVEGNGIVAYNKLYRYDIITNESTYFTESYFLNAKTSTCVASQKTADGDYEVYDAEYNLLNYDLSEYDFTSRYHEIKGATEDVIVFHTTGADDNIYTVIQNTNGDFICDPIVYNKDETGNYDVYFSENKVIIRYNKSVNNRIIDINTGEVTEYDDSYDIVDYDDINDLMLVKTNGAYYLADPEAPDTLINPFERASN